MLLHWMWNKRCKKQVQMWKCIKFKFKVINFLHKTKISVSFSSSLSFALWIPTQLWSRRHSEFVSRLRALPPSSSYNSDKKLKKGEICHLLLWNEVECLILLEGERKFDWIRIFEFDHLKRLLECPFQMSYCSLSTSERISFKFDILKMSLQ